LVEGSLGRGGVIVCALDLNQSWPEARHLLARMCRYAAGEGLRSATELSEAAVEKTMKGTALP
jgi:hypothetical protein